MQLRRENQNTKTTMKPTIIGWLAARGITLANEATDQAVVTALQGAFDKAAAVPAALGNEKTTLAGQVTVLQSEKNTLANRATQAETALANEQTARQAERKNAATLAVDLAIQRGKLTVADRAARIAALENSTAFDADVKTLVEGKPVIKTEAVSGRQSAALGNEAQALQNEYTQAFNAELLATGQNPVAAHNNIMKLPKYAGLAAKLQPKS